MTFARLRIFGLALGAVFTTATQLRPGAAPVGLGEVVLALWAASAFVQSLRTGDEEFIREGFAVRAGLFWLVSAAVLGLGALASTASSYTADTGAMHDALAYTLCFLISVGAPLSLRSAQQVRSLTAALVAVTAISTSVLLLAALTVRSLGPIDPWYNVIRFTGWATNPNQMALLVAACPFFAWQLSLEAPTRLRRYAWRVAAGCAIAAGVATLSDALAVAWGVCFALCGLIAWKRALGAAGGVTWSKLFWCALLPLSVVFTLAPLLPGIVQALEHTASSIYSQGGQGSARVKIWGYAIDALIESPLFGWGPGAHAGKTGPHQGFEAHNTFIDWAASSGVLGLAAYLMLIVGAAARAVASRRIALLFALLCLVLFSLFHFVLRHPMFWICLVVVFEYSRVSEMQATAPRRLGEPCAA